jgi:hypothetical protein
MLRVKKIDGYFKEEAPAQILSREGPRCRRHGYSRMSHLQPLLFPFGKNTTFLLGVDM